MSRRRRSGSTAATPAGSGELYDPTAAGDAPPEAPPAPAAAPAPASGGAITMYDAGGAAHEVSAAEAPRLLLGGGAFFSKDQTVHVKDERGHVYALPADKAGQAFASGMQIASDDEVRGAVERKEQNTIGKTLEAGAVGAGRGITLGLSDPLAIGAAGAFGGDEAAKATREHLAKLKEFHPIASTVGEVAGAVAPVLLSGGAGAAAEGAEGLSLGGAVRGLGVLPRAAAGAGEAVGGAARGLVGEGATGLLGRVAQRALPLAAQAGAEGAMYGAGGAISEAALGDEELTAEKVLAGAGHGAMLGAITGGALGSAYELGKAGLDKGLRIAGKEGLESWLQSVADSQTMKALGANSRDIRNLGGAARSTEQAQQRIGEIADTVRGYRFEDGGRLFRGTSTTSQLADDLDRAVDEAGSKLGKFRSKVAEITKTDASLSPDLAGYFKRLDEQVLQPMREAGGSLGRRAEMVEQELRSLRSKVPNFKEYAPPEAGKAFLERVGGENVGDVLGLSRPAEQATLHSPEVGAFAESGGVAAPNIPTGQSGGSEWLTKSRLASPDLAGFAAAPEAVPVSIEELTKARLRIDKILYPPKSYGVLPPPPEHFAELMQARQMLEQTIEDTTERALSSTGNTELAGSYQGMKSTFRDLSDARRMAAASDMRALSRNTVSLSDKMAAGSVLAGTLAAGGNPVPALLKAGAAGFVNNVVNQRANSMLATAADKAATIVGLGKVVGQTEDKMSHALNAFLSDEHEAAELAEHIGHVARESTKTALEKREELRPPPSLGGPEPKDMTREPKTPKSRYEQAVEHVSAMQQPGAAAEHVSKIVAPIAEQAPNVATAVVSKVTTAATYLASQKPVPKFTGYPGMAAKEMPNDDERAAFMRKVDGTDPHRVLAHLKSGELSHDEVEAFEATSPRLLEEARKQVFEKLAARTANGSHVPFDKLVTASTFMGAPLHPTLEPDFIRTVQSVVYQPAQQQQQPAQGGAPKRQLNIAKGFAPQSSLLTEHR